MQLQDIKKLAEMARIEMTDQEMTDMANDFGGILAYVNQVRETVGISQEEVNFSFTNVAREDMAVNGGGEYTDILVAAFPSSEDNYLKVKQVL